MSLPPICWKESKPDSKLVPWGDSLRWRLLTFIGDCWRIHESSGAQTHRRADDDRSLWTRPNLPMPAILPGVAGRCRCQACHEMSECFQSQRSCDLEARSHVMQHRTSRGIRPHGQFHGFRYHAALRAIAGILLPDFGVPCADMIRGTLIDQTGFLGVRCGKEHPAATFAAEIHRFSSESSATFRRFVNGEAANGIQCHVVSVSLKKLTISWRDRRLNRPATQPEKRRSSPISRFLRNPIRP